MKTRQTFALLVATALLSSGLAWTQTNDDDDTATATIRLMNNAEAELPDAVTKTIALPQQMKADPEAAEKAEKGLQKANQNRLEGNEGLEQAEEARQRGAEMSESAQENREDRGRSEDRPEPPESPGPGPN